MEKSSFLEHVENKLFLTRKNKTISADTFLSIAKGNIQNFKKD